ncbi:MAG TPA: hypothetical protein VF538_19760 [Pyrinomonadaceae bacterium]|jgi:hypothetical protein
MRSAKFIPAWLACAVASLLLHGAGGLRWPGVLPFALLSFAGATLIVRSGAAPRV